ncbi:MAG: lysylphosphatidylglycerol synthase transmembrane domain-containing protein [Candidatus Poribacteria bacterium]|nr:lysylphosphatidylglycerol synthase transmembrane domain-containing protein [Candidatus Poribacteria bacterium]
MFSRNGKGILNKKRLQKIARYVLPTVLAIVISYLLLKEIDLKKIPETLGRISVKALLVGFGCYCLLVLAKTLRFRTLLDLDSRVHQIFPILALHTFWGNFLPMRTGDISYVYLMQRRQKVDATQGIASLMVASVIDLALLIALMVVTATLLLPKLGGRFSWTVLYLTPLLIGTGLIILIIWACAAPNFCNNLAQRCVKPLLRLEKPVLTWITNKFISILNEITAFRFNLRFLKVWGYSLLCLVIRFGFQCYLVAEMGVDIPLTEVLFALAFTNGFNLLPIQTVGNFGTTEFPFAWFLNYFGTSIETATVTGFSLHILILLYCLPLGVYGFLSKPKEQ